MLSKPPEATTPIGTPIEREKGRVVVSVSTMFFPAAGIDPQPSDLILVSSDNVYFHIHSHRLQAASHHDFAGLAMESQSSHTTEGDAASLKPVPENAGVLNVILHIVYNISCAQYAPSLDTLSTALSVLPTYGISAVQDGVTSPIVTELLLAHAPFHPIESYALAAQYGLEDAAVSVSSHLLSFNLPSLTDELATQIGPLYLKRLFFLHYDRMAELKRILLHPPQPHRPVPACWENGHKNLTRLWALASAHIGWDARPNLSTAALQANLFPLEDKVSCELCKLALRERIAQLVTEWAAAKTTI